jgi:diguanylate cyclase (GGDEF)-like protein
MVGLIDYFDLDLLDDVLQKCHALLEVPISFISSDGSVVAKKALTSYSEIVEKYAGEDLKLHRREALESGEKQVVFPDGTEALLSGVDVEGNSVGAVVLGPFIGGKFDVSKASLLTRLSVAELESLVAGLPKLKEEYNLYSDFIAKILFGMLHTGTKKSGEISDLKVLHEIGSMLGSLEFDKLLPRVAQGLSRCFNATGCSLYVVNGPSVSTLDNRADKVIFNHVVATKNPLIVKDAAHDFLFSSVNVNGSVIALPLESGSDVLGVVVLYVYKEHFNQEVVDLFSLVVKQIELAVKNAQQYSTIKKMAITDELTGLANRGHFFRYLEEQYENFPVFSVALIDVDDFRMFNNKHGHPAGDKLLKELAALVDVHVGEHGLAARYGGEEFIVALPGLELSNVRNILDKLKVGIASHPFLKQDSVTVSIGLVVRQEKHVSAQDLVKRADEALYRAKQSGKNKLCTTVLLHQALSDVKVE